MLGKKVECKVTGLKGIATSKVTYINGCVQFKVTPKSKKNNMPDSEYIDVQQLRVIGDGVNVMNPANRIISALGAKAKCIVTGFKGIITAEIITISGEVSYCIKPKSKDSDKMLSGYYINSNEIAVTGNGIEIEGIPTGGSQRDCPSN